ncbi:MAG: hypothetical protein C0594_15485 [Marinilabiliales bacterium]|nr:MAG: hypothetical protein C0594_15485 [Marinilabiliales bacterium]
MDLYSLLIYFGIVAYTSLLMTFLSGIRLIKLGHKFHRIFGIISVALASGHAGLIIYLNYFS